MRCPKCGNESPDEAAYCSVCYEVLRKQPAAPPAPPPPAEISLLERLSSEGWTPRVIGATLVLFAFMAALREPLMRLLWPLDMVNLAFHEAGHPIFGLLGIHWIGVAGGTLMQLLMPAAVVVKFAMEGRKASACACLWWFGQNFLGIGNYMADARAQKLELIGAGEHDWTYLFESFGVLIHDVGIGHATQVLGCLIMAFSIAGAWVYRPSWTR